MGSPAVRHGRQRSGCTFCLHACSHSLPIPHAPSNMPSAPCRGAARRPRGKWPTPAAAAWPPLRGSLREGLRCTRGLRQWC